jgi:putative flavoprotein involved in K+ transport
MEYHDTIIIGGGQAGLALSRCLQEASIDHVVLERGRVGERWRSERWDSLRMLTPNWMTRLPGGVQAPTDLDGFMSKDDVVALLEGYASSFDAPVRELTEVSSVRRSGSGFEVLTTQGDLFADNVVIATGHCGAPFVPGIAEAVDPAIHQLHAAHYKNPSGLEPGGVLVVGAGASGLQIAAELSDAGRRVVVSSGKHARAVRRYRGRDLWWWLDQTGSLDQTVDEVDDIDAARRTPSLGLTGAHGGSDIDLGLLERSGVSIGGRLIGVSASKVEFDTNLGYDVARSDERLWHLLDRFDDWARQAGIEDGLEFPYRPLPVRLANPLSGDFDLAQAGIRTILWATGYRESYPWLEVPVVGPGGGIEQDRGVTAVPGLYVLGLRFQWRRGSHFLDGVGRDAEFLAARISVGARAVA